MTERRPQSEAELVEYVRAIDVPAPESVHRNVQALIAERSRRRWSPWRALAPRARGPRLAVRVAGAGGVLAAVAVVLVLALGGGVSSAPSLRQAAALTLMPATAPAPQQSATRRAQLTAAVDGVSFPYWEDSLGWRSIGSRSDVIDGRRVMTVFYSDWRGRTIGYAIVGGLPAPPVSEGQVTIRRGTTFRLLSQNGAQVVSWLRDGHLCVLSGRGIDSATLLRLASSGEAVGA